MNDKSLIAIISLITFAATVTGWLLTDTNRKIAELRIEMNNNRAEVNNEINNEIFEVRTDMRRMRIELREDLAAAKAEAALGKNRDPEAPEAK